MAKALMTPEKLIPLIKKDIESAEAATLPHYREVGELLQEAQCHFDDPRKWEAWLKKHFNLDQKTAWKYMRLSPKIQFTVPTRKKIRNG